PARPRTGGGGRGQPPCGRCGPGPARAGSCAPASAGPGAPPRRPTRGAAGPPRGTRESWPPTRLMLLAEGVDPILAVPLLVDEGHLLPFPGKERLGAGPHGQGLAVDHDAAAVLVDVVH